MEFVVQQSLEDTLRVRTVHLHHQAPPNPPIYCTKAVNVKLSGDGTYIGKRVHVVYFTFTLLKGQLAYSSGKNHKLGIKELLKNTPFISIITLVVTGNF